jgi:DNA-binding transcriptional regulator GbsR (MarR family)
VHIRDEDSFIEAMVRVLGAGLPPMAGRMWAYLAICEPPECTAAEIAERLRASRSSVSGMARILEQSGLIHRGTKAGDRRE